MRATLPLFASLMLMLTAWTVAAHAAHAAERPVAVVATAPMPKTATAAATVADRADPAGADHVLVHQHGGCHGHFLDVARAPALSWGHVPAGCAVVMWSAVPRVSGAPPPYLRPPQA